MSEPLGKLASLRPNLLKYNPCRTPQPRHCSGLQQRLEVGTEFIYWSLHLRGIPVGFPPDTNRISDGAVSPRSIVRPRALSGGIFFGYAGASMRNRSWRRGWILPRVMPMSYGMCMVGIDMYLQAKAMQRCTPNFPNLINELFFLLSSRLQVMFYVKEPNPENPVPVEIQIDALDLLGGD